MRKYVLFAMALLVVPAVFIAQAVFAGGEESAMPNGEYKGPAGGEVAEQIDDFALASGLAVYAAKKKDPVAMLAAAQMLADLPATVSEAKRRGLTEEGAPEEEGKARRRGRTSESLFEEAKALAGENAALNGLIDTAAKVARRGRTPCPAQAVSVIGGGGVDVYDITFRGGELAAIALQGEGYADLDLYVFDQNGSFIVADRRIGDGCAVGWYPRWTGVFRVEVRNLSSRADGYVMRTN